MFEYTTIINSLIIPPIYHSLSVCFLTVIFVILILELIYSLCQSYIHVILFNIYFINSYFDKECRKHENDRLIAHLF